MEFKATVIDSNKKKIKIEIIAEDRPSAISNLREQGFLILELYENLDNSAVTAQTPSSKNDLPDKPEAESQQLTHTEKPNLEKRWEWLDARKLWFIAIIFLAIRCTFNHGDEEITGNTLEKTTRIYNSSAGTERLKNYDTFATWMSLSHYERLNLAKFLTHKLHPSLSDESTSLYAASLEACISGAAEDGEAADSLGISIAKAAVFCSTLLENNSEFHKIIFGY